jgi:hypothetical protein
MVKALDTPPATAREVIVAPLMALIDPPSLVTLAGPETGAPLNWAAKAGSVLAFAPVRAFPSGS